MLNINYVLNIFLLSICLIGSSFAELDRSEITCFDEYKIYNIENPSIDLEFYRQVELLNTSGIPIQEIDDFSFKDFENGNISLHTKRKVSERQLLFSRLHFVWNKLMEHCDEAIYYAEKIENQRLMDEVSNCVSNAIAAIVATKNVKAGVLTAAVQFIAQFSVSNCYYFAQVKYHMWKAEEYSKEWDETFLTMKELGYL